MTNVKKGEFAAIINSKFIDNDGATTIVGERYMGEVFLTHCVSCGTGMLMSAHTNEVYWWCNFNRPVAIDIPNCEDIHEFVNVPYPDRHLRKIVGPEVPATDLEVFTPGPINSEERVRTQEERKEKGTVK